MKRGEALETFGWAAGAGVVFVGRILARGLWLFAQMWLARRLGPGAFGLFALGWTVLQIGGLVLPLGLHQSLVHYGSRFWPQDPQGLAVVLRRTFALALAVALGGSMLLWAAAPALAQAWFQKPTMAPVLRWTALAVGLAALGRVLAAGSRIPRRMAISTLVEDLAPSALLLLGFALLQYGPFPPLEAALRAMFLAMAGSVTLGMMAWWRLFPALRTREEGVEEAPPLGQMLGYASAASLAGVFTLLTLRLDRLLVGRFLPGEAVGLYQAATQPAVFSAMVLGAFNTALAPWIAHLFHTGQRERLNLLFRSATRWGLYLTLPVFVVLWMEPEALLAVLFGETYRAAAGPLRVLATAQMVNTATGAVGVLLVMTGHPRWWLGLTLLSLGLHLALGLWWIPRWGLMGAAFALALSLTVLFVGGLLVVRFRLGLWPYDRGYVKLLFLTLKAATVGWLYHILFPNTLATWYGLLFLALAIGMTFYPAWLALLDAEEKRLLLHLLRRRRVSPPSSTA